MQMRSKMQYFATLNPLERNKGKMAAATSGAYIKPLYKMGFFLL